MNAPSQQKKLGVAGTGALGSIVIRALLEGIPGYELIGASDLKPNPAFDIPYISINELIEKSDLIVECLPASAVPGLALPALEAGKDLLLISSAALLMFPEILEAHKKSKSRIIVPSGALAGLDGVNALREIGIVSAKIASTKKPSGYEGAPYVLENKIDLGAIKEKTLVFSGNALEAAKGFPANVNVAATLSLAGAGFKQTQVEVWADPKTDKNAHEIEVKTRFSTIHCRVENAPDPANPKSSVLAGWSIISVLKGIEMPLVVL